MNIIKTVLYGISGAALGYMVPSVSVKIIVYKKRIFDINSRYLYSKILKICLCLFNSLAWAMSGYYIDNVFVAFLLGVLITIGLLIGYVDINIRIIPNELVLTLITVGILFQTLYFGSKALIGAFMSMIIMMAVFTSVAAFVGFGKVGAGDVKLAGAMGIALGYPLIIPAIGIMAVVLLIFILTGMFLKKIYLSTMLPMAPFMVSGLIFGLMTLFL